MRERENERMLSELENIFNSLRCSSSSSAMRDAIKASKREYAQSLNKSNGMMLNSRMNFYHELEYIGYNRPLGALQLRECIRKKSYEICERSLQVL